MSAIALPTDAPAGPVIAHTDSMRTRNLIPEARGRNAALAAHYDILRGITGDRRLWFPSFNYDFLRSRTYSVDDDPSQVGAINESVRGRAESWRTSTPVFNFTGTGRAPAHGVPEPGAVILPFDESSTFAEAVAADGTILWYGAPISTATILHHAEHAAGGPAYRYDKDFAGRVVGADSDHEVVLRYHVRPLGRHLDYDWPRMIADATREGIIRRIDDSPVLWAPARALVGLWAGALTANPVGLLDDESRAWVEPMLDDLGRRFRRADFERED